MRADEDRELHRHLVEAERALGQAAGMCGKMVRSKGGRYGFRSVIRAREGLRAIRKALSLIQSIGQMVPSIDMGDRDMLAEEELARIAQQERQVRDEQRKATAQMAQGI